MSFGQGDVIRSLMDEVEDLKRRLAVYEPDPDPSWFAPGMREHEPDICWRLTIDKKMCCILPRGHNNGVHERNLSKE